MKIDEAWVQNSEEADHVGVYTMSEDEENVLWKALEALYRTSGDKKEIRIAKEMLDAIAAQYP